MKHRHIIIVIPAYNEEGNIGPLIQRIREKLHDVDILVIDDGSADRTARAAEKAGAFVARLPFNMGYGAALQTGFKYALKKRYQYVVQMDADGQHKPEDIPRLIEKIGAYDMVIGARTGESETSLHRDVANTVYNKFATYLTKKDILDLTSGFRAIRADIAKRFVYLLPNTFSYPTTLTLSLIRSGHSVEFIPIVAKKREGKSKIKLLKDGLRFFLIMLKIATLFSPFRVFLPVSAGFITSGIGYYVYTFITTHRFTNMSALLISNGIIIFMMALIAEQIAQLRLDKTEDREHKY